MLYFVERNALFERSFEELLDVDFEDGGRFGREFQDQADFHRRSSQVEVFVLGQVFREDALFFRNVLLQFVFDLL